MHSWLDKTFKSTVVNWIATYNSASFFVHKLKISESFGIESDKNVVPLRSFAYSIFFHLIFIHYILIIIHFPFIHTFIHSFIHPFLNKSKKSFYCSNCAGLIWQTQHFPPFLLLFIPEVGEIFSRKYFPLNLNLNLSSLALNELASPSIHYQTQVVFTGS